VAERPPLAYPAALRALAGYFASTVRLLWQRRMHLPRGFVSKLWLAHDERGCYRGVYEWDGPRLAENYARALWRVLAPVSVPGSVHYVVLPGLRRDVLLEKPHVLASAATEAAA
jgi:hypothetical protein